MQRAESVLVLVLVGLTSCAASRTPAADAPVVATFSIVGYDEATGELGVAVQSKFLAVGSVVPWAKAGVGAVATQSYANVRYGPEGLRLVASGKSPAEALAALTAADERAAWRQAGIVDAKGRSASFTGERCLDWAGHKEGPGYCAQGNLLAGEKVVAAMASTFEKARDSGKGRLADWLMAALAAGQKAGGDKRGRQSAALLIVRERGGFLGGNDRYLDLRVDDHKTPIRELARILELHKKIFPPARPRKREPG